MQDREAIRLLFRPAIADIGTDVVAARYPPLKLAAKRVVVLDARQHRHGANRVSRPQEVQPALWIPELQLSNGVGERHRPYFFWRRVRRRPGHPRLSRCHAVKTWMPAASAGMTAEVA